MIGSRHLSAGAAEIIKRETTRYVYPLMKGHCIIYEVALPNNNNDDNCELIKPKSDQALDPFYREYGDFC